MDKEWGKARSCNLPLLRSPAKVAAPSWKHGDDLYTRQHEAGGKMGKRINFTPSFLVNDYLIEIGSQGRVCVHEWACLQWGCDEYDSDRHFYATGQNQVKVTRCSSDLTGIYTCEKNSCTGCVVNELTWPFKEGCACIPERNQTAELSIMYMQSLSSVAEFCNEHNQSREALNLQNRMCDYGSTWEVIKNCKDFENNLFFSFIMICPAGVTGIPVFQNCSGDKCESRSRRYDGQLYEKGCTFIPDIQQKTSCSIMYLQYLPSVQFCDKNTHNSEAPNMQNKICNHKSTWEVIMESDEFRNSALVNALAPPSETTFRLLQTQDRAVALVLDVSGSMSMCDRIRHLCCAAVLFLLHIIEDGSWVGIVTFDSDASEAAPLQQITNHTTRQNLVRCLPRIASGNTNICAGVHKGLKLIEDKMHTAYGSEIVLLTDGEDPGIASCFDLVKQSGAKIHTIALGPSAAKELEEFSKLTGGLKLYAVDGAVPNKLTETFSTITSRNRDISEQSIQLESKEQVVQYSGMNTTLPVDKTVGNDTFFSIASLSQPFFFLMDPKGKEYGSSDFTTDIVNSNTATLSISGTAEVGDWQLYIKNVHAATQVVSVTAASRPARSDVPPVSIAAYMNRANSTFNPVVIYAAVSQGFLPVLGATVIATIEKNGTATVTLELLDNGAGADTMKNDGIYSRYFTSLQGSGRYSLRVNAHGKNTTTRLSLKQNRALYIPGYRENGKIYMNAPRPKFADKEIQVKLGSFSRISTSFLVVDTGGDSATLYPRCKVTDLHAPIEKIILSWTAPGCDLDNGKADHSIIKSSENLLDLRNHFDHATSVNSSNLIPKEAGREESFKIKSENFIIENGTIIYFALHAVDDTNLTSEVSNIAQVTWFIPPKASVPFDYDRDNDGATTPVIAVIVAVSIVVVCTIVSSALCGLQKQNGSMDIAKMHV
ncbi:LOW QUALITY PROTEIN: calcium-activated chloride channel regulator 1-like [Morus bassanus]